MRMLWTILLLTMIRAGRKEKKKVHDHVKQAAQDDLRSAQVLFAGNAQRRIQQRFDELQRQIQSIQNSRTPEQKSDTDQPSAEQMREERQKRIQQKREECNQFARNELNRLLQKWEKNMARCVKEHEILESLVYLMNEDVHHRAQMKHSAKQIRADAKASTWKDPQYLLSEQNTIKLKKLPERERTHGLMLKAREEELKELIRHYGYWYAYGHWHFYLRCSVFHVETSLIYRGGGLPIQAIGEWQDSLLSLLKQVQFYKSSHLIREERIDRMQSDPLATPPAGEWRPLQFVGQSWEEVADLIDGRDDMVAKHEVLKLFEELGVRCECPRTESPERVMAKMRPHLLKFGLDSQRAIEGVALLTEHIPLTNHLSAKELKIEWSHCLLTDHIPLTKHLQELKIE